MKAFILAAGLGTRLKPWTLKHPKALVPVGGVPMLKRVIDSLISQGFDELVINVHHFAEQIEAFLLSHEFAADITISDERSNLLDTGGCIKHAFDLLFEHDDRVLIHNVDILSNANLRHLMSFSEESRADACLLISRRESSRKLFFDNSMKLHGWQNIKTGELKNISDIEQLNTLHEFAFSGIHVISKNLAAKMENYPSKFSIIDFYLEECFKNNIIGKADESLKLIDIGKPETLTQANEIFRSH